MDLKRFTEWLGTVDGLAKAVASLVAIFASIWLTTTRSLDPVLARLGLPAAVSVVGAVIVVAAFAAFLWLSFVRFSGTSRLERPELFSLRATNRASLIGRDDEVERLLKTLKLKRLVLVDGVSGCGKSALVSAGIVPQLQGGKGLLPVVIRDWGDDWEHGPLAAAIDALFQTLAENDRAALGWIAAPDLASDASVLATELDSRLRHVFETLQRRVLLVADQFDDHLARHRARFADDEGNWLAPNALASSNRFWHVVSDRLQSGLIHLLVVARDDTAAGFACVRFLDADQTASHTVPRVGVEYIRPLLKRLAPADAVPPIVSNPAQGWDQLCTRLETDLTLEGAILMQQARTAVVGLRQLPLLTVKCYRDAGRLEGVETLVVSSALQRAVTAAGGPPSLVRTARQLLQALVLSNASNQAPKTRSQTLAALGDIAGDPSIADALLKSLQDDEIVRPAETGDGARWQLDHDYLARAVVADVRRAERWSVDLREGKARYDEAVGDWRRRWQALLPLHTQVRLFWERVRGRLTFGDASMYVLVSAAWPAALALALLIAGSGAYAWETDRELSAQADEIIDRFGGDLANDAVGAVWRAPGSLRTRVFDRVLSNDARLERALRSNWLVAHAGYDEASLREAAGILRPRLGSNGLNLGVYQAIVGRLMDQEDLRAEAAALRAALEHFPPLESEGHPFELELDAVAAAYGSVVRKLDGQTDRKAALDVLRTRLRQSVDTRGLSEAVTRSYALIVESLDEPADVKAEAVFLRQFFEHAIDAMAARRTSNYVDLEELAGVLRTVAAKLPGPDLGAELVALDDLLKQPGDARYGSRYVPLAYAEVASLATDRATLAEASAVLRPIAESRRLSGLESQFIVSYATVALRLGDANELRVVAGMLGRLMTGDQAFLSRGSDGLPELYANIVMRLPDDERATAVQSLRTGLGQALEGERTARWQQMQRDIDRPLSFDAYQAVVTTLAMALGEVASRLPPSAELPRIAGELREVLNDNDSALRARGYGLAAARLAQSADLKEAAAALRRGLSNDLSPTGRYRAQGYAAVVAQLSDEDLRSEVAAIGTAFDQVPHDSRAFSIGPLAEAYAAAASRLDKPDDMNAALTRIRTRLDADRYLRIDELARAYGTLADALLAKTGSDKASTLSEELLIVAGDPFVSAPKPVLAALKRHAGVDFGDDLGAAARWVSQKYHLDPRQFRPSSQRSTGAIFQ